jgi:predicted Zn finger-like uncharacterized protein
MNVSCPECRSVFRVDPAKVSSVSLRARCSVCGGIIAVGASAQWGDDFAPGGRPGAISRTSRETPAGMRPVMATPVAPPPSAAVAAHAPDPFRAAMPAPSTSGGGPRPRTPTPPFTSRVTPAADTRTLPTPGSAPVPPGSHSAAPAALHAPPPPGPGIGTPGSTAATPAEAESSHHSTYPDFGAPLPPPARTHAPPAGTPGHGVSLTPSSDASNAFTAPTTPTPPVSPQGGGRRPINPFLANDPNQKARRLARALVSDMVAYNPSKREEGLRAGTLKQLFREEIKKSYEEFVEQVGREFADSTAHFQDALNDVLAGGRRVF